MGATETTEDVQRAVPVSLWGSDHWSTLTYMETVCVDNAGRTSGRIALERMRCDLKRHPALASSRISRATPTGKEYPTRLRDGVELHDHDDWDCLQDAAAAGFIRIVGGSDGVLVDVAPGARGPLGIRATRSSRSSLTGYAEIKHPPRVRMTDEGLRVTAALRVHKARGGSFGTFVLDESKARARG